MLDATHVQISGTRGAWLVQLIGIRGVIAEASEISQPLAEYVYRVKCGFAKGMLAVGGSGFATGKKCNRVAGSFTHKEAIKYIRNHK